MTPTIRIDQEVYEWLQNQAEPFTDTPNSVLRRIARLEQTEVSDSAPSPTLTAGSKGANVIRESDAPRRPVQVTGKQLNDEWGVGAQHALYHRDGCWYNNLQRFPGALFDPEGYLLFETEEEYRNCPHLRIGKETNVTANNGIVSIPGYVKVGGRIR